MKRYNLTVYTYNSEKRQHEAEELYFDAEMEAWAKIHTLQNEPDVSFMELYEWNEDDDCYDFTERIERAENIGDMPQEEIIDRLTALRTYCDIALAEGGDASCIWESDVEALDAVIGMLKEDARR